METELLKTVGQIAGIGGIALGVFLRLFHDIIQKNIFPQLTKQQAYNLLKLISLLVWSVALVGVGAWVWTSANPGKKSITQEVSNGGTGVIHTGKGDININAEKTPEVTTNQFELGLQAYKKQNYIRAINHFQDCIDYRTNPDCWKYLAGAHKELKHDKKAYRTYKYFLNNVNPSDFDALKFVYLYEFEMAWKSKNYEEANTKITEYLVNTNSSKGAVIGKIFMEDGSPLPMNLHTKICMDPGIYFWSKYWNNDGNFLHLQDPGTISVCSNDPLYRMTPKFRPLKIKAQHIVNAGSYTLKKSKFKLPETKVSITVRKSKKNDHQGITIKFTQGSFKRIGQTRANGNLTLTIPNIQGRWRVESEYPGFANVWDFFHLQPAETKRQLPNYLIHPRKIIRVAWVMNTEPYAKRFTGESISRGYLKFQTYQRYTKEPKSGYSFLQHKYSKDSCSNQDIIFVQAGDSHYLDEVGKNTYANNSVEMFAGNFACGPVGMGGFVDLGQVELENVLEIPDDNRFVETNNRDKGVKLKEGHTYVLRTYNGRHYVVFKVLEVSDLD